MRVWLPAVLLCVLLTAPCIQAAPPRPVLDPAVAAEIDGTAEEWLAATGAPSTSIAIVQDAKLVYARAYGNARLGPRVPATSVTRYPIDSVSKEFTAAAVLILAEQGKLSLDDPVSKWFPDLGQASKATLRELLTHTSGIRDFWPQDFVPLEMAKPTTTQAILEEWAKRPLDFPPGTDWQYSNTGYVLAGAIIEKVSGEKLLPFLRRMIFTPLKMNLVTEDDTAPLLGKDAAGYTRFGLGPLHPAPKEGKGWLYGASNLAMDAGDLALWDISLIDQSLLMPASYKEEFERAALKSGVRKNYGLGLDIEDVQARRRIGHDGGGSGYLAANRIWPDDRMAIVVLTNNDWATPDNLLDRIAFAILPPRPEEARARAVFTGFQAGTVDRTLFTDIGNAYLSETQLADLKASLGLLGPARLIQLESESRRGGMVTRHWKILCRDMRLEVVERGYPGGKLEQFTVTGKQD
jgi:CubicO group peptidase (beta-lactamase class C family)